VFRPFVLCLLLCVAVPGAALAAQAQGANAHQWWDLHGLLPTRIDQPIYVEQVADNTYFSTTVFFNNTSDGAYVGLQQLGNSSRQALFAVWGGTGAIPGPGATCGPFSGEGTGQHCMLALPFTLLRWHTLRIERTFHSATQTAWTASVITNNGVQHVIGTIKTGSRVNRMTAVDSFDEYFGPPHACTAIPPSSVVFGAPRLNGVSTLRAGYASTAVGPCSGGHVLPIGNTGRARLQLGH